MMQSRFNTLWTRLDESGITNHVEHQTIGLYKTIRAERSRGFIRPKENQFENIDRSGLVLLGLVLLFGYSIAGLVFLMELCVFF